MTTPILKIEKFLTILEQSLLTTRDVVEKIITKIREENPDKLRDTEFVAKELVQIGCLTQWQVQQLMKGKYKGFFLRQYKILDHLGTGGMSTVYLAEHIVMHRRVAIKILPKKKTNSVYLERFIREAQAIAALDHPNIVHAYDIDVIDNIHYLVMEYFEGENLRLRQERTGPYSYDDAVKFILQGARGLAYAHQHGIIHRDVKPDNLLVNKDGKVKLLDLGLALLDESIIKTDSSINENTILGTADYLAPEQAINSHEVDLRADIYSLGCTLYYCLTAHPPFPTGTISQRLLAHQKEKPKSIFEDRPDAPQDLVDICTKMMAKNPDDRYASANELIQVLQNWLIEYGFASRNDFPDPNLTAPIPMSEDDVRAIEGETSSLELDSFSSSSSFSILTDNNSRVGGMANSSGNSTIKRQIPRIEPGDMLLSSEETSKKSSSDPFNSILNDVLQEHTARQKNNSVFSNDKTPNHLESSKNSDTSKKIDNNPQLVHTTGVQQYKNMNQNSVSTLEEKTEEKERHWSTNIPIWFWALFASGYVLSIFLFGILFALLSRLGK